DEPDTVGFVQVVARLRGIVLELHHVAEPGAAAPLDPEADRCVRRAPLGELLLRVAYGRVGDRDALLRRTRARGGVRIDVLNGGDFGVHESVPSLAAGAVLSSAARAAFLRR